MNSKIKACGVVRINAYAVISRAVDEGADQGWSLVQTKPGISERAATAIIAGAIDGKIRDVVRIPKRGPTSRLFWRALDTGSLRGYRRAFKYTNSPTPESAASEIYEAVMLELSEILKYEENPS